MKNIEPRPELLAIIMERIHKKEYIAAIRRVILFFAVALCSAAGFFPAFNMLSASAANSGFYDFLFLIFSDYSAVISYWQSFTMIILQTLPTISLAIFLAIILLFLQSIKFIAKDIKKLNTIKYGI